MDFTVRVCMSSSQSHEHCSMRIFHEEIKLNKAANIQFFTFIMIDVNCHNVHQAFNSTDHLQCCPLSSWIQVTLAMPHYTTYDMNIFTSPDVKSADNWVTWVKYYSRRQQRATQNPGMIMFLLSEELFWDIPVNKI